MDAFFPESTSPFDSHQQPFSGGNPFLPETNGMVTSGLAKPSTIKTQEISQLSAVLEPLLGDADGDGDTDNSDVTLILNDRNKPLVGSNDLRDFDRDGRISIFDARKLGLAIAANTNKTAPVISASLFNDTAPNGTTNTDGITSDASISGKLTDTSKITRFRAGFNNTPVENFTDILGVVATDGSFSLTPEQLAQINGGSLLDDNYTLHLQAKDQWGNLSSVFDVRFTLDRAAPTVIIAEPLEGTQISRGAELIGMADGTGSTLASLSYQFTGGAAVVVPFSPTGQFQESLDLSQISSGFQTLAVTAIDLAGNTAIANRNVEVVTVTGELDEALDLGTLVNPLTLNEFIGDTDPVDLYRFNLGTDSVFTLNLDGLSANADVDLIQDLNNNKTIDENEFLNFSMQEGTQPENLSSPLALGTYYIRIRQVEGNTSYALELSTMPVEGIPVEDSVLEEENSPGEVSIAGVSETTFNSLSSPVVFQISGATFSPNLDDILLFNNDVRIPNNLIQLSTDDTTISISSLLAEGFNDVELYATDNQGTRVFAEANVLAGSNTLSVIALNENGQPISDAVVNVKLTEDQNVLAQATTSSNGQVIFQNIPNRTIFLEAVTSDNRFSSFGAFGSDGNIILTLKGFNEPSPIDNNDFSLGTDGWNIGTAPVTLIPHQEPANTVQLLSLAPVNQSNLQDSLPREYSSRSEQMGIEVHKEDLTPSLTTFAQANQMSNDNIDLLLNTSGEGEQSITRTFTIKPNTKSVTVRYRFITSEVPGGYFGSQFNDYFRISIRSLQGGGTASEANSMNGLGLGAFDANGATAFREVTLPTSKQGDTVQVEVAVANVADGFLDSQVVVDLVEESNLAITQLSLRDIDNAQLQFLSVNGNNPYFGGNTRVNGTITLEGDKDDSLNALELQIVQGGAVVATANLANNLQGTLLNQPFGDDGRIEINTSQLLFNLPNGQAANINVNQNGTVNLRVRATSANGGEVIRDFGPVQLLGRYIGTNRYGQRDNNVGGDDWARPSVIEVINHFGNQITLGDFSNMNGGTFPPHGTHNDGTSVDGWFNGYNARDAATAQTMINLLNDPTYGSRIQTVGVTFQQVNTNSFWNAIKNVTLNDGRRARDVIRPWAGHTTHFHWVITP